MRSNVVKDHPDTAVREELINEIRRVRRLLFARVATGGAGRWLEVDLTIGQLKVVMLLGAERPMRMREIADSLGISLPAATSVVERTVTAGLVERCDDPADRRVVLCRLTRKGTEFVRRFRDSDPLEDPALLSLLSTPELKAVIKAMSAIRRALSDSTEASGDAETEARAR